MYSYEEKIELLDEARDAIIDAIDKIERAAYGTEAERTVSAYTTPHLFIWAGSDDYAAQATAQSGSITDIRQIIKTEMIGVVEAR